MGGTSKRRRRNDDYPKLRSSQQRKKHLYLALDDWNGGYSIHRLDDADDILDGDSGGGGGEEELPEPAAIRIASRCDMSFAAVGSNIFIGTNRGRNCAPPPPTLVYDTKTAAISAGPLVPECIHDLGAAMAVGENLYAPTTVPFIMSTSLQVLSMEEPWDPNPTKEWSWNTVPSPSELPFNGIDIIAYAVHRDGRTIFISAGGCTYALDTSNGVCKELGEWLLPFRGQAFFDSGLDAWVGLHREHDGRVCCCPATSLSVTTTQQPAECRMLMEKLLRRSDEDPKHWSGLRVLSPSSLVCCVPQTDGRILFRTHHLNGGTS
ncbi:hypothetical protein BDA96_05G053100 [Sorghum bicolor]|uniref:Uncharacterized protein n=1 Tax=Sorghum bicolor TaxID=4558 RepID=A0A921QVD6_SORBI|nr:uncharacterized protein LOC8073620 [Sorghum bicolor]KAG0528914.1 hypothetical protein BDA96_05G053100 [Sorghum bicolor]|eukprot:XP_002449053.2 uncharacterized protein LOC8073620 [Sorghum bicolor]